MSRYIDADALRKELEEIIEQAKKRLDGAVEGNVACRLVYTTQFHERDTLLSLVNWMPTADVVEVRHGEWLLGKYKCMDRSVCSVCNAVYEGGDAWNYCPCCGAKMDGEGRTEQ